MGLCTSYKQQTCRGALLLQLSEIVTAAMSDAAEKGKECRAYAVLERPEMSRPTTLADGFRNSFH